MAKKLFFCLTLASILLLWGQAGAAMRSVNKIRAGTPPYEVMRAAVRANNQAISRTETAGTGNYAPWLTWLTDPAPAIRRELVMAGNRQVCVIRNLGAQLEANPAAVDYGVRELLTPVLMITLDSDNAAVKRFLAGIADAGIAVRRELSPLHPALAGMGGKGATTAKGVRAAVEKVVDYQVGLAVKRYRDRVRAGRLVVVGTVLDLANSYRRGRGRLIIINVNGETEPARLRVNPALKTISPKLAGLAIGRR